MAKVKKIGFKGLVNHLRDFETRYGMSSAEFFSKFSTGALGDAGDFITWAGLYEMYLDLAPKYEKPHRKTEHTGVPAQ